MARRPSSGRVAHGDATCVSQGAVARSAVIEDLDSADHDAVRRPGLLATMCARHTEIVESRLDGGANWKCRG